uniref:Uncharacterized protein ycf35 n=1 Tax=Helminthora furcellata TaxID=1884666 RepID=A0A1G4NZH3_9FLOR|nr:Hypothetical protein ycf35 [Helminthora furcellata]SCW21049.1 Hypothetical protein ycf35 [Helminthora furcellata]SCW23909.1 Hypothetical protein ycf35 [Helminthora furcellata]
MSHLSKIKTKMRDGKTLIETLDDFQISYTVNDRSNESRPSISLKNSFTNNYSNAQFIWIDNNYELIADSSTWQEKRFLEHWQHKFYQKYACNMIIREATKEGFKSKLFAEKNQNNGSLKIVLEKWR